MLLISQRIFIFEQVSDTSSSEEEDERPAPTILKPSVSFEPPAIVTNKLPEQLPVAVPIKISADYGNEDDLDDWLNGGSTVTEDSETIPTVSRLEASPRSLSPDTTEAKTPSNSHKKVKEKKSKRHHKSKKSSRESAEPADESGGQHGDYEEI